MHALKVKPSIQNVWKWSLMVIFCWVHTFTLKALLVLLEFDTWLGQIFVIQISWRSHQAFPADRCLEENKFNLKYILCLQMFYRKLQSVFEL